MPNCYAVKVHGGPYGGGQPDVLACHHGRMYQFEVKAPGGQATKLQVATLARWKAAGALTGIVYSVDDVKQIIAASCPLVIGKMPLGKGEGG